MKEEKRSDHQILARQTESEIAQKIFGDSPKWKFTIDTSKTLIEEGIPSSAASLSEKDKDGNDCPVFTIFDVIAHWCLVATLKRIDNTRRKSSIKLTFEEGRGWGIRLITSDNKYMSVKTVCYDLREAIMSFAGHVAFLTRE